MKTPLLFGLLSIFCLSGFAQLSSPHFISVNVGTNIPVSDYKELDSIVDGGAKTGLYYSFEGGAYFSKVLGIGLNVGAFSNSVNEDDILDQLKKDAQYSNGKLTVNSDDWVNGYIMLGPILSFGSKKFIVDLKLLGGFMNTAKPFINIESSGNNLPTIKSRSNEVTASNFGFNYGVHFRLKLIGKLGLRINAEGFMSSQEFETTVQETDSNGNTTTTKQEIEKKVQAMNLGAGLILTL